MKIARPRLRSVIAGMTYEIPRKPFPAMNCGAIFISPSGTKDRNRHCLTPKVLGIIKVEEVKLWDILQFI